MQRQFPLTTQFSKTNAPTHKTVQCTAIKKCLFEFQLNVLAGHQFENSTARNGRSHGDSFLTAHSHLIRAYTHVRNVRNHHQTYPRAPYPSRVMAALHSTNTQPTGCFAYCYFFLTPPPRPLAGNASATPRHTTPHCRLCTLCIKRRE